MKLTTRKLFGSLVLTSLMVLSSGSPAVKAEEKDDEAEAKLSVDALGVGRIREDKGKLNLQGAIKLRFTLGLMSETGKLDVVAVTQSGSQFNNAFASVNVDDRDERSGELGVTNLYLRYATLLNGANFTVEAGALETRKPEGEVTRLYPFGYLDGARIGLSSRLGEVKGSVTLANVDPRSGKNNFFDRKNSFIDPDHGSFNYVEVAFRGELWKGSVFETSLEDIEDNSYVRLAASQEVKNILKRNVKLILESIYDEENNSFRSGVMVESDLAPGLTEKVAYTLTHRPDEYDNYRVQNLIDHTHIGVKGTSSIVKFSNPDLGWYLQARFHHEDSSLNRYDFGYIAKWGGSKTKKFTKKNKNRRKRK